MKKKLKNCRTCGQEIAKSARTCPHCGAKNKKSFFKRLFVLLIAIVALVVLVNMIGGDKDSDRNENNDYEVDRYVSVGEKETESTVGQPTEQAATDQTGSEETEPEVTEETETTEQDAPALVDGMRPEFKEALDSYEEFFDEYCKFMEKYAKNPTDLTLLADYAEFMTQYAEMMEKLEALDDGSMNDAETKYYIEVTTRITQNLNEVAVNIG